MKAEHGASGVAPFDTGLLDRLMEERGLDLLLVTSKHNVQHLLGGYRFFMFDYMDATGLSRYLPIFIYRRGHPEFTGYVGNPNEAYERDLGSLWPSHLDLRARGSVDAMRYAMEYVTSAGIGLSSIGVEAGFLPADAMKALQDGLPAVRLTDCVEVLEELRAIKSPAELECLRIASEGVVDSMLATFARIEPGLAKRDVVEILRQEEVRRGLNFEYCLITAGKDLNRAPSDQRIREGDILSLDSGGNYRGYIGDLCRMGILGRPSPELEDALAAIEEIQQLARRPIRQGAMGAEIFEAVAGRMSRPCEGKLSFVAHGMGLISHEAPRLLDDGPIPYPAAHRNRPLRAGMVLSIETTLQHPHLGFIKLEDTVAVTDDGCIGFGDAARGWNSLGR
ncbi:Xaa-Pro aminopeptidase [Rhizobium subbaraonis]|uniref:Xaa-Pro aminopeptidase n=1 Tax=Rhizobium subbaraonis TaxID=908946 RepID=A0A285U231_9HYPH|nr:Xaa-Pro peptidase family protein [Rhizobium subbaraonis]SOC35763.1 Xaa-Pro aminopeptidase [Rhizobium subbaraonis]